MGEVVTVSIDIDAPPELVYDVVADLPGMGRFSPENTGGKWLDGATTAVKGARFRGTNRRGPLWWWTLCTITEADRGKVLEWVNHAGGLRVARWRYEFRPNGTGTTVVESTEDRRGFLMRTASPVVLGVKDRAKLNKAGMEATLRAIKAELESR